MKNFLKRNTEIACHIDRVESRYGNVMVRGWAICRKPGMETYLSVWDEKGNEIPVYTERLVRADVNATFEKLEDCKSGFHILIDRAVLDTPDVWLVVRSCKENVPKTAGEGSEQALRSAQ